MLQRAAERDRVLHFFRAPPPPIGETSGVAFAPNVEGITKAKVGLFVTGEVGDTYGA